MVTDPSLGWLGTHAFLSPVGGPAGRIDWVATGAVRRPASGLMATRYRLGDATPTAVP